MAELTQRQLQILKAIIEEYIETMRMKVVPGGEYLYTGILIEAGHSSETDIGQNVSVDELGILVKELSRFRRLRGPFSPID